MLVVNDGGIREVEYWRHRAVVGLETENGAIGVPLREAQNVGEISAAKGVDRLRVVADDHQIAFGTEHRVDDVRLQAVGVLILVDQNVGEALPQLLARARMTRQQEQPVQEQIVEVHQIRLALALEVALEHRGDELSLVDELGRTLGEDRLQVTAGVDDETVEVDEKPGPGQAACRDLGADVGEGCPHHLSRVLAVEDRKTRRVAYELCVASEDPVAGGVEGAAGDPGAAAFDQLLDPAQHLASRLVGEGQKEDAGGRDAVLDQPAGAVDKRARLAGSRAGERQHGPPGVHHHGELLGVELLLVTDSPGRHGSGPLQHRA